MPNNMQINMHNIQNSSLKILCQNMQNNMGISIFKIICRDWQQNIQNKFAKFAKNGIENPISKIRTPDLADVREAA
jgi:hypothetical protein